MKKTTLLFLFSLTVLFSLITSCKKEHKCYDDALYQKHKNDICPMNCPEVVGCDDKIYCNECIANTNGIRVK